MRISDWSSDVCSSDLIWVPISGSPSSVKRGLMKPIPVICQRGNSGPSSAGFNVSDRSSHRTAGLAKLSTEKGGNEKHLPESNDPCGCNALLQWHMSMEESLLGNVWVCTDKSLWLS